MKKLIAFSLVLCIAFSFVACGKGDNSSDTSDTVADKSSEVAAAVESGKIPEMKFALGGSIDDLSDHYDNLEKQMNEAHTGEGHVHTDSDIMLNVSKGELSVTYEIGEEKYYYERAKRDNGISVVCSLSDAFGFAQGTLKSDIEAALPSLELSSLQAGEDELYFVPLAEAIILRYKKGAMQLDFYFNNNELVATVLRNTENWTI